MITRIVKLPKHDDVLIGRDLGKIFENGHVYEIKRFLGEILIKDIGESALGKSGSGDWPTEDSEIDQIMMGKPAKVYFTEEEWKKRRNDMESYETGLMDQKQLEDFVEFFDRNIGTDYEINYDPAGSDKNYVVCFELELSEVKKLRDYENDHQIGEDNG